MNKKAVFTLALLLAFLLCACGGGTGSHVEDSTEVTDDDSIWMTYSLFNGVREYPVTFSEETVIIVEVLTDSGELGIDIVGSGGESFYSGRITDDQAFAVTVPAGNCTVRLTGLEHIGEYGFNWEK